MATNKHIGKVILAAAGPGDPDLITVRAARYLQQADIVLTDRLASEEILERYVRKDAVIVYVGKQGNKKGCSVRQSEINQLLVKYALQYKLIVRLKGGDVAIFSNILDELQTLVENGIPYEIIPGITAALGASAYAGIPLTARGYSASVRFLTYHKADVITDEQWEEIAATDDTLVFYMTGEKLDIVADHLLKNNIAADKLLAVIEQSTTPAQKVSITSLYDYDKTLKGKTFASPSLVIVGRVVALHEQFAWLKSSDTEQNYFKTVDKIPNL